MKARTLVASSTLLLGAALTPPASGQSVALDAGRGSVLLGSGFTFETGLAVSATGGGAVAGSLPGSIGLPVRSALETDRPTTLTYDAGRFFSTQGGRIEFNGTFDLQYTELDNELANPNGPETLDFTVSDLTFGYDSARDGGNGGLASGYFLEGSPQSGRVVFFDLGPLSVSADSAAQLTLSGDLFVSQEFGDDILQVLNVVTTNPAGARAGTFLLQAGPEGFVVPEPASASLALAGLGLLTTRRRR